MSGVEEVVEHPPDDTGTKETEDSVVPDVSGEKTVPDKVTVPDNTGENIVPDNNAENIVPDNTEETILPDKDIVPDIDNTPEKVNSSSGVESVSSSLTDSGNWTIVDKEEEEVSKEIKSNEEVIEEVDEGSKVEEVKTDEDEKTVMDTTDSESIETISEDESLVSSSLSSSFHAKLASFCFIPDSSDALFPTNSGAPSERMSTSSMISQISIQSMVSDGIPINDESPLSEDGQPQYEWSSMEEGEGQDGSQVPLPPEDGDVDYDQVNQEEADEEDEDIGEINDEDDEDSERRVPGDDSEPGYDLDDDGLPGAPLAPLNQDVELYPSQELDENFQVIEKGEVYKHYKNLQLDHLLTAILVLSVALVIGLGIGHFLGLSERLEVQEMYEHLQDEKLDHLQDDLVDCIDGEEGRGGDDQDLDDRVIRQLWEENQELRDQVQIMKANSPDHGEEAMTAILRDKINELITANGELEREVARLRYVEAARGAAESVETLNELRKTRDTLNDIVTENDQLKIQVVKSRYGEPFPDTTTQEERDNLVVENQILKEKLEDLKSYIVHKADDFESDSKPIEEHIFETDKNTNDLIKDDLRTPWPSRRHVELTSDENQHSEQDNSETSSNHQYEHKSYNEKESKKDTEQEEKEHDDDDDDDEILNESMNNLSNYLSHLVKSLGSKIVDKEGNIDWNRANRFIDGLKTDVSTKFSEAGQLAKEELNLVVEKFDELKSFVDNEQVKDNMKAARTAANKFVKTLVDTVDNLKEATEDAAERSDWYSMFQSEASKVKSGLESRWDKIKVKWQKITEQNNNEKEKNDDLKKDEGMKEGVNHNKGKKRWSGADEDEGYETSDEKQEDKYKSQKYKDPNQRNRRDQKDLENDEGYSSSGEKHEKFDARNKYKVKKEKNSNNFDDESSKKYQGNNRKHGDQNGKHDSKKRELLERRSNTENQEDWSLKRGKKRDKLRQEDHSDWMFERAKHRKDTRDEESRGDWYFERRDNRGEDPDYPESRRESCQRDDEECHQTHYEDNNSQNDDIDIEKYKRQTREKPKGEKYKDNKRKESVKRKPVKGETDDNDLDIEYDFEGQMHYVQRNKNGKTRQYRRSHSRKKYFDDEGKKQEFHHFESDFGNSFY